MLGSASSLVAKRDFQYLCKTRFSVSLQIVQLLPASSDDAVRDADFVELLQLPEPSPAELSAAAVTVAVIGALIDMVDVVDTDT
jgi:hypothetical protein